MNQITPAQSKAARALLGWTQQDLAQRANVAISTVADFERGKRSPVSNNLDAMRSALEQAGVTLLSGGAVAGHPQSANTTISKSGAPIRWVDATDLSQWAERRDAQELLPELFSRLILATTGNATKQLRFGAGDSVQQGGWDGVCEVETDAKLEYLPVGRSGWELSTQRQGLAAKASDDFNNRTKDPGALDPRGTTFVFATPRRWSNGARWARDRKAEHTWVDVRVIDADDLVHWLELFPTVGYWLAAQMNKRPPGVRQLAEAWQEWRVSTQWPLTTEILLTGRDKEAMAVLKWLYSSPKGHAIQADSPEEAIAFLYAAIAQLPESCRNFYHSKCLIASTPEAARALGDSPSPLVIVLDNADAGLAARLVERGHHVFLAFGSATGAPDQITSLPRPPRDAFKDALFDMGISEENAGALARDSARSFAVLRRLIPSAPAAQAPEWARPENARPLLGALFAGAWNAALEGDRSALERLAGVRYDTAAAGLTRWVGTPDSPLRIAGDAWKITSPLDAWFRLARHMTASDVERFREVALDVLGSPDRRFDVDPDQRWLAGLHGQNPRYSELLRTGLAETLVLLSVHGNEVRSVPDAHVVAERVVRALLSEADERRWWSISGQMQVLAEAAPDAFLDAVDNSLSRATPSVMALFKEDGGPFGGGHHPNLLWALETLGWSPRYLGRVAELLGRLARFDPGGRLVNRPKNSLRHMFLLWLPQTNATLEERLRVLDRLRRVEPDAAWTLMLGIMPAWHDVVSPSPQPRWREFSVDRKEVVTDALIIKGANALADRILEDVGLDPFKWEQLLDRLPNAAPEWRAQAMRTLSDAAPKILGEGSRVRIWGAIRKLLNRHRSFPSADWAMPSHELDRLEEIYDELEPREANNKLAWLFSDSGVDMPRPTGEGWEADEKAAARLRRDAVAGLLASGGIAAVLELAGVVTRPAVLGAAFAQAVGDVGQSDEALLSALRDHGAASDAFAHGLIVTSHERHGQTWSTRLLNRAQSEGWAPETIVRVLLALPSTGATWERAASFGEAVNAGYWKRVPVLWRRGWECETVTAIGKLIDAGRARDAVHLIGPAQENLGSELLIRALTEAARQPWPDPTGGNDAVMFQWAVEQIFQRLDKDSEISEDQVARLEWTYLSVLQYSHRPPVVLHKLMSANPEFFLEVLCAVFRPSPESGIQETPQADESRVASIASQAYNLLQSWTRAPGETDGRIDPSALQRWVKRAREICTQAGRAAIGDQYIGRVLAHAPADTDGAWPQVPVRDLIDEISGADLETGLLLGAHDKRGVTWRGVLDGGIQESGLANTYRDWSDATKLEWPRTSTLLRRIAASFEEEARHHDERAQRTDWSH